MTNEIIMTANVATRKTKNGFNVALSVQCNKFTTGRRVYHTKINFVGDVDHWTARVLTELVSDIEGLNLNNAIRALEVTHCGYKNIYWNLLTGNGYAVNKRQRPYYNSSVYTLIMITQAIKTKKEA